MRDFSTLSKVLGGAGMAVLGLAVTAADAFATVIPPPPATNVPEPSTMLILGAGAASVIIGRRFLKRK